MEKKTKTYKANTGVSLSVPLPSGKSLRVSFLALSDGTSVYATDNPQVQAGLERHSQYGKLFWPLSESGGEKHQPAPAADGRDPAGREAKKVKVSDLTAAKDYLADTFGVSRTSLRTRKSIMDCAASHGVELEGIDN